MCAEILGPHLLENHMAIGFRRNTGIDPLQEAIGPLGSDWFSREVCRPSVKYVDGLNKQKHCQDPPHGMFWIHPWYGSRYASGDMPFLNAFNVSTYEEHRGLPVGFLCSGIQFYVLLNPYLCFISFLYLDYMFLEMMH